MKLNKVYNQTITNKNNIGEFDFNYDLKLQRLNNQNQKNDLLFQRPVFNFSFEQCILWKEDEDFEEWYSAFQYKTWVIEFTKIPKKYLSVIKAEIIIRDNPIEFPVIISSKTKYFEITTEYNDDANTVDCKLHLSIFLQVVNDSHTVLEYNFLNNQSPVYVKPVIHFNPLPLLYKTMLLNRGSVQENTSWNWASNDRRLSVGEERPDPND